tara:strand:+ start:579 stop:767 length:189 start_codon:yes stop_codon:yes gene_type:complete
MDIQELLNTIKVLENKKLNFRSITINDVNKNDNYIKAKNKKEIKIKGYRAQEEYGEKKFIKP